jgi:NADPH-dependent curcumin reductase CurA
MTTPQNTRVLLARRPQGEPRDSDFEIDRQPLPELAEGEILIRNDWLSIDPYMRGRLNDARSYAPPVKLGEPIVGETAGIVLRSRSPHFAEGDALCAPSGWQSHYATRGDRAALARVDAAAHPLSTYLGVLGMPGRTAYFGLLRVGRPQPGETVVVSAAAGAVGSAVGQIAKQLGCRSVGVAGGAEKCRYVVDELGFDACVDYKAGRLDADLRAACPDGIDVYFENVGGAVARAVAAQLRPGARVPICGFIASYNAANPLEEADTPFKIFGALSTPPEHRMFLVGEFFKENAEANGKLSEWLSAGKLRYRESVLRGLEHAPAALRAVLRGENLGKQLVQIA